MSLNRNNILTRLKELNPTLYAEYSLLYKKGYGLSPNMINSYLKEHVQQKLNKKFSEKLLNINLQPEGKPQIGGKPQTKGKPQTSKQEKNHIRRVRISHYRETLRGMNRDLLHVPEEVAPEIQDIIIELTSKESFDKSMEYLTSIDTFSRDITLDFIDPVIIQEPILHSKGFKGVASFSYDNNITRTTGGSIAIRNEDIGVFFQCFGLENIVSSYEDILKNAHELINHKQHKDKELNIEKKQEKRTLECPKPIKPTYNNLKQERQEKIISNVSSNNNNRPRRPISKLSHNTSTLHNKTKNNKKHTATDNNNNLQKKDTSCCIL